MNHRIIANIAGLLLLAGLLLTTTGCILGDTEEVTDSFSIDLGDPLPDFSIRLNDGTTVSNETVKGKVSLIILMTTVCPDCQKQLPIVERIYREYKDNDNVTLFAIGREQSESQLGKYWSENDLTLPYSPQEDSKVYNLFAGTLVPRIYISDPDGIVRNQYTDDPLATYDQLKANIEALLQ